MTQLQGQSQGLGLCRQLYQTSGQAVARRHHPCASFLTVQGLLRALGPLMDPNSNSSLFFFPAVGFQLDNEQSHSPHIAILLVLTWGRGQDLAQREEGRPKHLFQPAQGDFWLIWVSEMHQRIQLPVHSCCGGFNLHPWPLSCTTPPVTTRLPVGPHSKSAQGSD